jgi:ABC-2 type transport system permease protein
MNMTRFIAVARREFLYSVRRPLFWIMILMVLFIAFGLSNGNVRVVTSGDAEVGGTKAWVTSEFSNAFFLAILVFLLYIFFISVVSGLSVIRDEEQKISEILRSTPMKPAEYIWGKALAILAVFLIVLCVHAAASMFFNHAVPHTENMDFFGPFHMMNYIRPIVLFGVPIIVFIVGLTFFMGELTRNSRLLFFLPVILVALCVFFLWDWSPDWLNIHVNQLLMFIDPSGFRWLWETWMKVDMGVDFYNNSAVPLHPLFILSRIFFILLGFTAIALSQLHFRKTLRTDRKKRFFSRFARTDNQTGVPGQDPELLINIPAPNAPLQLLEMHRRKPLWFSTFWNVLRTETRELRNSAGLYLFIPVIMLDVLTEAVTALGPMDTPLLITPGQFAVHSMGSLTVLGCLLLLFYTVESIRRESSVHLSDIFNSSSVRSSPVLLGKAVANGMIGFLVVMTVFVSGLIILSVQGTVPIDVYPFILVWGLLLLPTYLVWSTFVMAMYSLVRNRYTTYAVCIGALIVTGFCQITGHMNWTGNWNLWNTLRWSDMGTLELNRYALVLNRLMMIGLAAFFTSLAVTFYNRRTPDGTGVINRMKPGSVLKSALPILPFLLVPLCIGIVLFHEVRAGHQGSVQKKIEKDYWRHNLATWKDVDLPDIAHVEIDAELFPRDRQFTMDGWIHLVNNDSEPIAQIPFTCDPNWDNLSWTMNDSPYEPDNRSHLFIFSPDTPLEPGNKLKIGFRYTGIYPKGSTKNGGGSDEFILPAGVVLTSFNPGFVPYLGYIEEIGIDKDNHYESRDYPDDFYLGETEPLIGSNHAFTTRIRVTAPEEYTVNSVGRLLERTVCDSKATCDWQCSYPVRFFNIVAGRWNVRHGEGTALYYHPEHTYNIEEIGLALDAARKHYSEWFMPYPWDELKISEFPGLAYYAQGFPTNITFSEALGFLTKSDPDSNMAFFVTAHESAHQWWANILMSGKGPGGNVLLEGMANFSSMLLIDEVKGKKARMDFAKRLEHDYGEDRQADSERPLVKVDGTKPGDTSVTYNRSAWVYWMMLNLLGKENALAGLQDFIITYKDGPDYPVLQDLVDYMRDYTSDTDAYDRFVNQYFFDVALPEYRLSDIECHPVVDSTTPGDSHPDSLWKVSVRIYNAGTGDLPVEIAATRGNRFDDETGETSIEYREVRSVVEPGSESAQMATFFCPFKPEQVIVDPDFNSLQLNRHRAICKVPSS